jgi:hypothetical protein
MRRYHDNNDDDPFDERGILKDGRSIRTSLAMMDSDLSPIQQAIARSVRVTDGSGGTDGLNRPGWRLPANDALLQSRNAADADYLRDLTTAWQRDRRADVADAARKRTTHFDPKGRMAGYSVEEFEEEDEEKHGTERQTSDAAMRARDKAHADYEKRITTAYLNPAGFGGDPKNEQGDDDD